MRSLSRYVAKSLRNIGCGVNELQICDAVVCVDEQIGTYVSLRGCGRAADTGEVLFCKIEFERGTRWSPWARPYLSHEIFQGVLYMYRDCFVVYFSHGKLFVRRNGDS